MLTELRIANFAVIEQLGLDFSGGFQVFTGETGAGKSIIVDAIALLVGGRASADQIRAEADEAELEGSFRLDPDGEVARRLREADLLPSGSGELVIRRVLSRSGRHRVYVNGALTPLHLLQSLGGTLVDIHGQHEQQSLLSAQAQLDVLDAFGRLRELRAEYVAQYDRWKAGRRALEEALRVANERADREEMLRFQAQEITQARLQPGEDVALAAERGRLAHAHRLAELAEEAYAALYESDAAIVAGLGSVSARLAELAAIDPSAADWTVLCREVEVPLRELVQRLRAYREDLDSDPDRLSSVEERLDRIHRLTKKYGGSVEAVLAKGEELECQLDELAASDTRAEALRQQVAQDLASLEELASRLTAGRARAAKRLETRVEEELSALRMEHTRFKVQVTTDAREAPLGPTGRDRVEYLLAANPGEPLQPLARVASGGELSRVMLALKSVLAETDRVPVLIFDEVDAGVGGVVAAVMGQRLRGLAKYHQVFCITHLPQVASQAQGHYRVEKTVVKKRTVTRVRRLEGEERREEVARMLAGLAITKAARDTAAEMIREVEQGG